MKHLLTITATNHTDPESVIYTLTETFDIGVERPSGEQIREYIKEVQQRYIDSFPRVQGRPENTWRVIIEANLVDMHIAEAVVS